MKHVQFFLLLAILLCLPAAAPAEPAAAKHMEAIDSFVQSQMRAGQIPGLALAILEDGEITYIKGYGSADDTGTPVTEDTPFATGSVGKSFTAL